jgi:hypothetical protein
MSSQDQSNKHSELLDSLVNDAYKVLVDGEVTCGEVVSLGGSLAGKANQFQQLSGLEKRDLVLSSVDLALKKLLAEMGAEPSDDSEKASFLSRRQRLVEAAEFAKKTLPSVLNLAVDCARGKIDLRKEEAQKTCQSIFSALFRCVSLPKALEPIKAVLAPEAPKEEKKHEESASTTSLEQVVVKSVEEKSVEEKSVEEKSVEENVVSSKDEMTSPVESTQDKKE